MGCNDNCIEYSTLTYAKPQLDIGVFPSHFPCFNVILLPVLEDNTRGNCPM